MSAGMWNKLKRFWAHLYLQYSLATGVRDFEPWEAILLNTMVILTIALVSYSSCVYLPYYLMTFVNSVDINFDSEKVVVDYPGYTASQI